MALLDPIRLLKKKKETQKIFLQMETRLSQIVLAMQTCEKESENCINALNQTIVKWESIRNCYDNFPQNLGSLSKYKGLRSKLEMEQLVTVDKIIAELHNQMMLHEHSIKKFRGSFVKEKENFAQLPLDAPWKYPPEDSMENIGDQYQAACMVLQRAQTTLEKRKLALFNLESNKDSFEPEVLLKFIQKWKQDV